MASRRMIDPAFWLSETMADLSIEQRYLFIGIFSNADDQGRMGARSALIRSVVFPYDDIALDGIERDLSALCDAGCIYLYEVDGKQYLQIINWWKYQNPQWAYPSKIPAAENWQDKLRYRAGGEVKTENWGDDCIGGFLAKELPKALPISHSQEDSQEDRQPHSIVQDSIVQDSIDSSGADAPPLPKKPAKKPLTGKSKAADELAKHFCVVSGIPMPPTRTKAQGRAFGKRWRNPLLEIHELDPEGAKRLVTAAIDKMRTEGLTLSAPQSIVSVATSIFANGRASPKPQDLTLPQIEEGVW